MRVVEIIILTFIIIYFIKKLVESVINLSILLKRKNYYDTSLQRKGIVLNKDTKRLEADNSIILPFKIW